MAEDKRRLEEAAEVSQEELEAAADMLDRLMEGAFYQDNEAATAALFGHKPKYIN